MSVLVKKIFTKNRSDVHYFLTLEVGDDQLDDKIKVAEELNEYFVNIVEITTGKNQVNIPIVKLE